MKNRLLLWLMAGPCLLLAQTESLRVFDAYQGGGRPWMSYRHLDNAWYGHLHQLAQKHMERRVAEIAACTTPARWETRKKTLRENLLRSIGGLPEKTPLEPQTVGVLDRPTFTVEKIIYSSLPGFYVTACLFVPKKRQQPAPAVIYCSGHAAEAFRSEVYQRVIINLVEKGFIVLAFDPIGQGERYQYLDENDRPDIGGPTSEHSYAGLQCLLKGQSIARYMIHDGIRAVDYLLTRPEVDPQRIGITGRSGGGTQSAYIAAFDDRILAAAPENYITSFARIWAAIGPQDAEQNFLSAHVLGIDHGDLLSVRAPKPALMLTTTRDYFSIQGARETFREVQGIYRIYDALPQFGYAEDDHQHGSTPANREAMNAFFQRALALPGDPSDHEVELFSAEELTVTSTGQVVSALQGRTVFDLIQMETAARDPHPETGLRPLIREITGIQPTASHTAVFTGRIQRQGYTIEKYFLEFSGGRYPIPFLWASAPSKEPRPLVLYLNSLGKESDMAVGGEIEALVRAGFTVLAADLLHTGELSGTAFQGDSHISNVSYNLILGSSLVGKSLTALQTEDLYALLDFVRQQTTVDPSAIIARADRQLCLPLLHYAALEPTSFSQLILQNPLASWQELLQTERYQPELAYTAVPGALPAYDLPDLLALAAPPQLRIIAPQNARGERLPEDQARLLYRDLQLKYAQSGHPEAFALSDQFSVQDLLKWMKP